MITGYSTRECLHCGKPGFINVEETELFAWLTGTPAQEAFKSLPVEAREQIISGTHPKCWEEIFQFAQED